MNDLALAGAVIATARDMNRLGINRGSAGNVSARCADGAAFIVTPTGLAYDDCRAEDGVKLALTSPGTAATSPQPLAPLDTRLPSSEWRFHHDIYRTRADVGAIVHTHSPFATALACQQMSVPAFHYMVARFGGDDVRCADYATFGTQALADAVLMALSDRKGCLMAHHGMLVAGGDLRETLALAVELETLCEQYWRVLQLGPPRLLPAAEMKTVLAKFASYGQQAADR